MTRNGIALNAIYLLVEMVTNTIVNGDCMALLPELQDDCVDMTILDPNYDDWDDLCEQGRTFTKSDDGIWLRDHLHFNKPHQKEIPSKPIELIKILVKCFCPKDGIVLDPFMGSGTTAVACVDLNRRYIGYEIDEKRIEIIKRRLHGMQLSFQF